MTSSQQNAKNAKNAMNPTEFIPHPRPEAQRWIFKNCKDLFIISSKKMYESNFPISVCDFIWLNYIKVSEYDNGTYYHRKVYKNLSEERKKNIKKDLNLKYEKQRQEKSKKQQEELKKQIEELKNKDKDFKNYMQKVKYLSSDTMDDNNKNILNIGIEQGEQAMFAAMFKDPKTNKPLSYGEMRRFYG